MPNSGHTVYEEQGTSSHAEASSRLMGPGGTEFIARHHHAVAAWKKPAQTKEKSPEAYQLRLAMEQAQRRFALEQTPSARMAHEVAVVRRRQFWTDTCRPPAEMRLRSTHAAQLNLSYGCRFATPSLQQVQYILNALDAALPSWERDHAELFFQTLELNFPDLVKYPSPGFVLGPQPAPLGGHPD